MAVVLTEGFDMYNGTGTNTGIQAKWTWTGTISAIALVAGVLGGQAVQVTGASAIPTRWITRSLPSALSAFTVGFQLNVANVGNLEPFNLAGFMVTFTSSGSPQFGITVDQSGAIRLGRGTNAAQPPTYIGNTVAGVIVSNTNHYVEISCSAISATVGAVNVYVDGVNVGTFTGLNNKQQTPTTMDGISIIQAIAVTATTLTYDDIYVTDSATPLGPRRVETLRPNADTATKNWTPNSGANNYDRVNETLVDGDTSYVQASSVGTADLYDLGNLTTTPVTIDAVSLVMFAEKTDVTSRTVYQTAKSGATSSDGTAFALVQNSYGRFDRVLTTDPNTSAAWTASAVNALQIGPKVAT